MPHESWKNIFGIADVSELRRLVARDRQSGIALVPFVPSKSMVDRMLGWLTDPEVAQYYWDRPKYNEADIEEDIMKKYHDLSIAGYSIVHPTHGAVGYADIMMRGGKTKVAEASVLVGEKTLWRTGIGRASLTLLCFFAKRAGIQYVFGEMYNENVASQRLVEQFPHNEPYQTGRTNEYRILLDKIDFSHIDSVVA
jgi:RimJ/RimL family protein N-acetyltransferase